MPRETDFQAAERLTRKRARMLPFLAIIFLSQQVSYFAGSGDLGSRPVDHLKISAWLVLSIVLLLALTTGGFWFRPKRVRNLIDDEPTRANRAEAFRVGFLATMAAAIALYFISLFEPLGGREAVHVLMSIGIATSLLRFGYLERRDLRE